MNQLTIQEQKTKQAELKTYDQIDEIASLKEQLNALQEEYDKKCVDADQLEEKYNKVKIKSAKKTVTIDSLTK